MTIKTNCEWTPQPEAGDWASFNAMDFTLDTIYEFSFGTTVQSEVLTPKFLIIDNTQNANYLTLTMGILPFTIPAATRCTVGIPDGMTRFSIVCAAATGTASVIVSEKKYIDDVSNQSAVVAPPGAAVQITRQIILSTTAYVVPANCHYIEVEAVGGGGAGGGGSVSQGSSGGGAGGRARKLYAVVPAQACTVVIGTGGVGGAGVGGNGVDTTFTDGVTTITGKGGIGGTNSNDMFGFGGSATNGDLNESGDWTIWIKNQTTGGAGAHGFKGPGGAGVASNVNGVAAAANTGAGGGGGGDTSTLGGNGGSGFVIITEYLGT